MCGRKSRSGFKIIVMLSVLFVLLVSPCFAASSWAAWFTKGNSEPTVEPEKPISSEPVQVQEVKQDPVVVVVEKVVSSEKPCTTLSEEPKTSNSTISDEALSNLEQEFTNYLHEVSGYVSEVDTLKMLSEKLQSQLDALQKTDAISEAEYQTVKASLLSTVEMNEAQAERLAQLEKEARTKAFALGGAFIGFEDSMPLWGVSATLGVRFGKNVMCSIGADYEMGSMKDLWKPELSLDNLRIRAQMGWMW